MQQARVFAQADVKDIATTNLLRSVGSGACVNTQGPSSNIGDASLSNSRLSQSQRVVMDSNLGLTLQSASQSDLAAPHLSGQLVTNIDAAVQPLN